MKKVQKTGFGVGLGVCFCGWCRRRGGRVGVRLLKKIDFLSEIYYIYIRL
jgi:hypothetical protein